jgi:hypothetical protein
VKPQLPASVNEKLMLFVLVEISHSFTRTNPMLFKNTYFITVLVKNFLQEEMVHMFALAMAGCWKVSEACKERHPIVCKTLVAG